jgi:hypothetical protein
MTGGAHGSAGVQRGILALVAVVFGAGAWADDICSAEEHQRGNTGLAQAQAAEKAGDLLGALRLANGSDVRECGDDKAAQALAARVTLRLGNDAETAGKLPKAFEYFDAGGHFAEAKRVGLAQLKAAPADRGLADKLLPFMRSHEFADGVAQIQTQARGQADRLLAEEEKSFAIRAPHQDLLTSAQEWLRLAGDDAAASVKKRALARADQYAALDYPYALNQAISYYSLAGSPDGETKVRAKAGRLAQQLAGGDQWAQAAELYEIAGDEAHASALRKQREAQAQQNETTRKQKFEKEQGDLEKELGF